MFKDIQDKLNEIDKRVWLGLGVVGGLATTLILYKVLGGKGKTPVALNQSVDSGRKKAPRSRIDESENPEKTLIKVVKGIKRTIQDDRMTYETVKAIYEGQYELSRKEFQNLVIAKRAERRQLMKDMKRYLDAIADWDEKLEDIHNNHLNAILAHFKIDK